MLLKPPFTAATLLLWLAPLLALLAGIAVVWRHVRAPARAAARGTSVPPAAKLSATEEARLARLLGEDKPNEH